MSSGLLPSEAFSDRMRARQRERSRRQVPFPDYGLAIAEAQTGRLDFRRFPYQEEPYRISGDVGEMVVDKGTQVGFTTMMLRWTLWCADELGLTGMYVFPTDDLVKDFSTHRMKPLLQANDYLRAKLGPEDPNNAGLRKIGRGYIFFRGSMTATALDSVPVQALVLDEYDELNQDNVPVAERRLGAAQHGMVRRIGVPTLEGTGIDQMYAGSDMRRWVVRCEACNHWQRVTWDNMRWEEVAPRRFKARRVCEKCERDLDVALGEWVAEHPDRDVLGYHVPRLIVPRLTPEQLGQMVADRTSEKSEVQEAHYQRDMAEGYETPESRLSVDALMSCRRHGVSQVESYVGFNPVTMGIDQSTTRGLHVRISEHLNEREKRVLLVANIRARLSDNPDEPDVSALRQLAELMERFHVHMACIDHLPDGIFARAFCSAHPGRAYMVAFNTTPTAKHSIVVPRADRPADRLVVVKRTEYITATLDLVRAQRNLLMGEQPWPESVEGKTYLDHMRNAVRTRLKDKHGREFYGYKETGPVDFLMAELYDVVATDVLARRLMEGHITGALGETEVTPEQSTADFNDWEGRPWDDDQEHAGTYGAGWSDEYR